MFRVSWLITTTLTLFSLTAILVLTRDLAVTNDTFKAGVAEVSEVNGVTDSALEASAELPAADEAIINGLPEVAEVSTSLARTDGTLHTLSTRLDSLGVALDNTNEPLPDILHGLDESTGSTEDAIGPAARIADRVAGIEQLVRQISTKLGISYTSAKRIEAKLRVLLLVPRQP